MAAIVRPCPFCGSQDLDLSGWAVECNECGTQGPLGKGSNAIELWERREQSFEQYRLQNPHIPVSPMDV